MADLKTQIEINAKDNTKKATDSFSSAIDSIKSKLVALAGVAGLLAAIDWLGDAVKQFSDFDDAVRSAAAVTGDFANALPAFTEAAKKFGEETRFTATQSAEALKKLAAAGLDVEQSIGALPEVLKLASASGIDLATSADILTNIVAQYGLTIGDLSAVNDKLVNTFTSTNTGLADLGLAFSYVGPVAKASNQSFNELAATLGVLGNNGFKGDRAGTALRSALIRLQSPARRTRQELKELSVNTKDAAGEMRPFSDIIDELSKKGASNAQIFKIFGTEAAPAILALFKGGTEGLRELAAEMDNVTGLAADVATKMESGLGGSFRVLSSAVEGTAIAMGEASQTPLQEALEVFIKNVGSTRAQFVELAKDAANAFNSIVQGIDAINGFKLGVSGVLALLKALTIVMGVTLVKSIVLSGAAYVKSTRILSAHSAALAIDARMTIASTQVEIVRLQTQIRATAAQILAAQTLATKTALTAQLTALNAQLAASNKVLAATELQLAAATTKAALSLKTLLAPMTLLNLAFTGLVAWEIGTWARENFAWAERIGINLAEMVAKIILISTTNPFSGELRKGLEDIETAFNEQRERIGGGFFDGDKSKKQRDAEVEAVKKAGEKQLESEKKLAADKVKLAEKQAADIAAVTERSDEDFDARATAQKNLTKITTEERDRQLRNFKVTEDEKRAEIETTSKSEKDKIRKLSELDIESNKARLNIALKFNADNLLATEALFNSEISLREKRGLDVEELEKELLSKRKESFLATEKAYEESINELIKADKKHRDAALGFAKEIEQTQQRKTNFLRDLENTGVSDAIKAENQKKALAEDTSKVRRLLADGDFKGAIELSKKNEKLAFDVAATNKKAAAESSEQIKKLVAERQKLYADKGGNLTDLEDRKKDLELQQEINRLAAVNQQASKQEQGDKTALLNIINQTKKAQTEAREAEIKQAETAKTEAEKQKTALEEVREKITEINTELTKVETLSLIVDDSEIDDLIDKINKIPDVVDIKVSTNGTQSADVSIPRLATGGNILSDGLAYLHSGETVLNKNATAGVGQKMLNSLNSGKSLKSGSSIGTGETTTIIIGSGKNQTAGTFKKDNNTALTLKDLKKAGIVK